MTISASELFSLMISDSLRCLFVFSFADNSSASLTEQSERMSWSR